MISELYIIVAVVDNNEYPIRFSTARDRYYLAINEYSAVNNDGSDIVVATSAGNLNRENHGKEFFENALGIKFDDFYVAKYSFRNKE